jgi:hypothetical protein
MIAAVGLRVAGGLRFAGGRPAASVVLAAPGPGDPVETGAG